nr:gp120=envelope protein {variable domains V-1 and V-2} [feline immunodeficiency virus FIV, Cat 5(1) isolate, Peptide Partial, 172 aa] [Feline immunodeficiency virus]
DFDIATQMNEEGPLNPGVNPFRVPGITEAEKQDYCAILQPKLQDLRNEIQEVKLEEGNAGKFRRVRFLRYSDETVLSLIHLFIGYCTYLCNRNSLGSLRHDIDIEAPQEEHYNNKEKGDTDNIKYGRRCFIGTVTLYLLIFTGLIIYTQTIDAQVVWRLPPLVVPVEESEII